MQHDSFFNISQKEHTFSGGSIQTPVFLIDVSDLHCLYRIPTERVEPFLKNTTWKPVLTRKGETLAGIRWRQVRDSDWGAFNETELFLSVCPKSTTKSPTLAGELLQPSFRRVTGYYVIHRAVTSTQAKDAYSAVWGFPGFQTEVEFSIEQELFVGKVQDPESDDTIMTLTGDVFGGLPFPGLNPVLYSVCEGQTLRTVVNTRAVFRTLHGTSFHLLPGYSKHPMKEAVKSLGLQERHPAWVRFSNHVKQRVNEGKDV